MVISPTIQCEIQRLIDEINKPPAAPLACTQAA
jgi:hypothetical protein